MSGYDEAISDYNLRELKKMLAQWNDDSLAIMLHIDIMQARLLKRIIEAYQNKEDE